MAEERTDLDLVAGVKAGDESCFEELVGRYAEKAYSLASRLTRNQEDAEEVLQDVFVALYRKIGSFEGKSSFSSWLYRITVNAGLMKIRKRKQDRSVHMEDVMPQVEHSLHLRSAEQYDADNVTFRRELIRAFQAAIGKLPEDYRPVFVLRDIDGLTSREVSEVLGLSIPAVKSRLHRARLMLQKNLVEFHHSYEPEASPKSVGNL